jgi:hypothetical protein
LGDYMQNPSWTQNIRTHYGYESLAELQQSWLAWVSQGSGPVDAFVKNAPQTSVIPASVATLSPRPMANPAGQRQQPQPADGAESLIARASATSSGQGGWYTRLRQEALVGKPIGESSPIGPTASSPAQPAAAWPRSLGPQPTSNQPLMHSAAQPQPEQGMAPGGGVTPIPSGFQGSGQYLPGSLSGGGTSWR